MLPPILPGSEVKHTRSGETWIVYSCDSYGFYAAGWPEGYCRLDEVEVVRNVTPIESLKFLANHPPKDSWGRGALGSENIKWLALHLASTDEEYELLEAISKVGRTGNAVNCAQVEHAEAQQNLDSTIGNVTRRVLEQNKDGAKNGRKEAIG